MSTYMRSLLIVSCLIYLACKVGNAQEIRTLYTQFTVEDGLPSNDLNDIIVDNKGYLWFLGDGRAIRYNGEEFKEIDFGGFVSRLWKDSQDRIWVGAYGALFKIEEFVPKLPAKYYEDIFKTLSGSFALDIAEDSAGNIWYTVDNAHTRARKGEYSEEPRYITVYKLGSDSLISINLLERTDTYQIGKVGFVKPISSNQVVFTGRALKSGRSVPTYELFDRPFNKALFEFPISRIKRLQDGTSLAMSVYELMHFDKDSIYYLGYNALGANLHCMYEDRDGNIWVGTVKGLWKVPNGDFKALKKMDRLPDFFVTGITQDFEGNLWLSTSGNGLIRFSIRDIQQLKWKDDKRKSYFTDIEVHEDAIWLSSTDGSISQFGEAGLLSNRMLKNAEGGLQLLSMGNTLICSDGAVFSDGKLGKLTLRNSSQKVQDEYMKQMFDIGNGKVLALTRRRLFEFDLVRQRVLREFENKELKQPILGLSQDPWGRFWALAGEQELYEWAGDSLRYAQGDFPSLDSLKGNYLLRDIQVDTHHNFIFTLGDGVLIMSKEGHQYLKHGKGLTATKNYICSLISEENGLWITGFGGVDQYVFDTTQKTYIHQRSFGRIEGLPMQSQGEVVLFKGKHYLASKEGLFIFDLGETVEKDQPLPPTYMLGLETSDSVYMPSLEIQLAHDQNNISIELDVISFSEPEKLLIWYRLKGLSETWQETSLKTLSFTNLKPGDYTLEVLTNRIPKRPDSAPKVLKFSIIPHVTQTLIFQVLMGALGAILVGAMAYRLILWKDRQDRRKRMITQLKYQALQSQMSPHFIFNAMNSISYLVKNNKSEQADSYLNQFAGLLRGVLENAQYSFIPLLEEIELVQNYLNLEQLQFGQKFKFFLDMDPKLMKAEWHIPPMLLQPVIENAIRHGISPRGQGNVKVDFLQDRENLRVVIEDDGIGRRQAKNSTQQTDPALGRTQVGIKNIQARIAVLNRLYSLHIEMKTQDLLEQGKAKGTRVIFIFPKIDHNPEFDNSLFTN